MVNRLYYSDPYLRKFQARVVAVDGDRIVLDQTAFYPGGGGQQSDSGTIDGKKIERIETKGDEIYHIILGGGLVEGLEVSCEIDWNRRYDLMMGHTGQHILFRSLQEQNPELKVAKVDIAPDRKALFVDGEITWDMMKRGLAMANDIILSDMPVIVEEVALEDVDAEAIRIKKDRIRGDEARIVRVGDFDAAACGGLHVRRTGEIGGIGIIRRISGRQASDWEIQFEVGGHATSLTSQLALVALSVSDELRCPIENVESTVRNLRESETDLADKLKEVSKMQLESLEPEVIGSFRFYSSLLSGADRKMMGDIAAKLIRDEGTVVLLCDASEGTFMLVGCNNKLGIDCRTLLKEGLDIVGGQGGGKKNFAMGGSSDSSGAERAYQIVREMIMELLSTQHGCS